MAFFAHGVFCIFVFYRPGSDLLSHALRRSTIGAEEFDDRVRDGIGYRLLAITTRSVKDKDEKLVFEAFADCSSNNAAFALFHVLLEQNVRNEH